MNSPYSSSSALSASSINSGDTLLTLYFMDIEWQELLTIATYYARSTIEIATSLVQSDQLTTDETERLLHEATPTIRQYLEQHLPASHPILGALAECWKLALEQDPDHHHILL